MTEPTALEPIRRQQPQPLPKLTDQAITDLVESIQQFEKFKKAALTDKDYSIFGENLYIEKPGWTKLRLATVTSFQIIGDPRKEIGQDSEGTYYTWIARGRATAINGVFVEMDGACSSRDEFFSMANGQRRPSAEIDEKDIIATAETNCFNRCMSFLYGFGELSGEELRGHQFDKKTLRFPFPDEVKGKTPEECDLATLKKHLPTFEKAAKDPKNKWAEQNKKLVAAIQASIAEKTAKVESPAGAVVGAGEHAATPGGGDGPAPPAGDPSPLEQAQIRVRELCEAKGWTEAKRTVHCRKTWNRGFEELDLLAVQTLIQTLVGLPDAERTLV
ncbi:MAG TPA: hypothetical protein DIW61_00560 [Candidatus Aminicenantes bacterium]|nr:hypothetical protein [Candidatus Aminicenantes bacterium]